MHLDIYNLYTNIPSMKLVEIIKNRLRGRDYSCLQCSEMGYILKVLSNFKKQEYDAEEDKIRFLQQLQLSQELVLNIEFI